ncbi:MAG: 2-succinyl-5-enolpyruvyl-6-hydroxy-3-cyclohexene-1-carboxylic-acid synthase [Caldilineales bacterium]
MTATSPQATRAALLAALVRYCVDKGINHAVIAPGSRSAPLTAALVTEPGLHCLMIPDERAAGYVALGLAQQSGQPVMLVCTSGTAALNFAPAVAEAHYQGVPLLVLTADRPPEWVDQQDNQAIHQTRLYEPHLRAGYQWPTDWSHADARWHVQRTLDEAIELSRGMLPGPVHINVPLREPLYPALAGEAWSPTPALPLRHWLPAETQLSPTGWQALLDGWQSAVRKLIVVGLHPPDADLQAAVATLATRPDVAVLADVTANLFSRDLAVYGDALLDSADAATRRALAPDLVISLGGPITSKALRSLLREHPPAQLWRAQPAGTPPDTFQRLTHVVPLTPGALCRGLAKRIPAASPVAVYAAHWRTLDAAAATAIADVAAPVWGELSAFRRVVQALPAASGVQIGNSMSIRYANLLAASLPSALHRIDSNRGTSGIDGTLSTAVGAALARHSLMTLLVGDLGFFYDRNGLWHSHLPATLRIVLFNNHGGGIFDIIDGPNRLPTELHRTWFLTPQPLTAARLAADHGLAYHHASNATALEEALAGFFADQPRAALLEIETDMAENSALFRRVKTTLAALRLPDTL